MAAYRPGDAMWIHCESRDKLSTAYLEAMMLTWAIHTNERRQVAVTEIPGAFLQANINEDVHMILEGEIAKLILKLEPKLYRNMYGEINTASL